MGLEEKDQGWSGRGGGIEAGNTERQPKLIGIQGVVWKPNIVEAP